MITTDLQHSPGEDSLQQIQQYLETLKLNPERAQMNSYTFNQNFDYLILIINSLLSETPSQEHTKFGKFFEQIFSDRELVQRLLALLETGLNEYGEIIQFLAKTDPKRTFFTALHGKALNVCDEILLRTDEIAAVEIIVSRGSVEYVRDRGVIVATKAIQRPLLLKELAKALAVQLTKQRGEKYSSESGWICAQFSQEDLQVIIDCLRISWEITNPGFNRSLVKIYKKLIKAGAVKQVIAFGRSDIARVAVQDLLESEGFQFAKLLQTQPCDDQKYVITFIQQLYSV